MYALKVFLVSLMIISIDGAPADVTTPNEDEYVIDQGEQSEPFDPEQYRQYLLELQCQDIFIGHVGTKTPEDLSGSIYKPTTTTERIADEVEEVPSEEEEVSYEEETQRKKRSTGTEAPTEACTAPLADNWESYNWYQILVNNGGAPGNVDNVSAPKPNLTKAVDPCARPLRFTSPLQDEVWYTTKSLERERRVYREERVSLRFPDTPKEFVDVRGLLVWSPPGEKHRSYHISYRKDDTGLYVMLDREHRCRWDDPIYNYDFGCGKNGRYQCFCEDDGNERCVPLPGQTPAYGGVLTPGLEATLIGGGK